MLSSDYDYVKSIEAPAGTLKVYNVYDYALEKPWQVLHWSELDGSWWLFRSCNSYKSAITAAKKYGGIVVAAHTIFPISDF